MVESEEFELLLNGVRQTFNAVELVLRGSDPATAAQSIYLGDDGNMCCLRSGGLCYEHEALRRRLALLVKIAGLPAQTL